ncbi:MAG: cellobiose phosphorylase [PVC group bacterium]|nr:cellobiose phosphorylase [PVC group bacterium]
MKEELWKFINNDGDFIVPDPEKVNRLYFPLANEAEFMSAVTPLLQGDIKIGQNHFLTQPITSECLYNIKSNRNFWLYLDNHKIWSLTGVSYCRCKKESMALKAGMLWHTITRTCKEVGLESEITNFVPVSGEHVELMRITIKNISKKTIAFTPTSAIPLFGRSADNLRDHRHVTSLLNRIKLPQQGIILKPVMSFDERGHKVNQHSYFVFGLEGKGTLSVGFFPTVESFIGEGGCLEYPKSVVENRTPVKKITDIHQGKEAMGALRFKKKTLKPGASVEYIIMLGIAEVDNLPVKIFNKFNTAKKVARALNENKAYWKQKIDTMDFVTGDKVYDRWLKWVRLQPVLRKIFGCSFLPEFDYGRGGKGWRDLWQDCLTLIFINPKQMRKILTANFSGVRIDGTNATIITKKPGHFIADRNKISRTWMDHGVWPYFTLQLYMHQTGDLDVLFDNVNYFYDQLIFRAKKRDSNWKSRCKYGSHLHTRSGKLHKGTILEHVLVSHLTAFFNVGNHNNMKLEDADWNDGLDMAHEKGESVAFTCFYAWNIYNITILLNELKTRLKKKKVFLTEELLLLLDTSQKHPVNYNNAAEKRARLAKYFSTVKHSVSGKKKALDIDVLIKDLTAKWKWLFKHVQTKEWVDLNGKEGVFNGYYDNKGRRVEGKVNGKVRMTLTGQVFPIMSGIASKEQSHKAFKAAQRYLKQKQHGGYRLNTDFESPQFDLGRAFAFAYGHKENGAVFSHMCVMFANALYQQGLVNEGYEVIDSLFNMALNTPASKIYPCLPEYFDLEGRGMYSYLTGSASWYVMTVLTEIFGIKGHFGELVIAPKLAAKQFIGTKNVSLRCNFAGRSLNITFKNPRKVEYEKYAFSGVTISPQMSFASISEKEIIILRKELLKVPKNTPINIEIILNSSQNIS